MFAVQDRQQYPRLNRLLAAFGAADFQASGGTGDMLVALNEGKALLGYNMMGSYALTRSKQDLPNLGVVFPRDYTLVLSRILFVSKRAAHPNAARLWVDYMLSARGQKILGDALEVFPIRTDVKAAYTAGKLRAQLGRSIRPIPIDMRLADALEPARHETLLREWSAAIDAGR
jgi:iron(III) transport system substrate-binding protein